MAKQHGVDATSRNVLAFDTSGSFLLKNLGPEVVYLGRVQLAATPGPINTDDSWPVAVGEVVQVPDTSTSADTFLIGVNTATGESTVALMGHSA